MCDNNCRDCNDFKCRCSDCASLTENDFEVWFCDEYQKPCKDVKNCGEYD